MIEAIMTVETNDEWLKTTQAAKKLGITPRGLQKLVERGDILAYRIGRVLRFRPSDVETYLDKARTDRPKSDV